MWGNISLKSSKLFPKRLRSSFVKSTIKDVYSTVKKNWHSHVKGATTLEELDYLLGAVKVCALNVYFDIAVSLYY